jgi:hypothetical protein
MICKIHNPVYYSNHTHSEYRNLYSLTPSTIINWLFEKWKVRYSRPALQNQTFLISNAARQAEILDALLPHGRYRAGRGWLLLQDVLSFQIESALVQKSLPCRTEPGYISKNPFHAELCVRD